MIVTAITIWLIATEGLALHGGLIFGAVLVDIVAWANVRSSIEVWATGSRSDQGFWED